MYTVVEHPVFQRQAEAIWSEDERLAFTTFIARNPFAGDVIPAANGARKVRWTADGRGKRGGVRVIYFNFLDDGQIELFAIYSKTRQENLSASDIRRNRR